jgi:periplasmic protein TonB
MEPKKTVRADLTRKSFLFFNIGLATSISLAIFAFSFKTTDDTGKKDLTGNQSLTEELVDVPATEQLPPPPPKIEQPQIVEVKNDAKLERDIVIDMDVETSESETSQVAAAVQVVEVEAEDLNTLFTIVEETAAPVGGINAFNQYVAQTVKYPAQARRIGIQGRVFVEFVVERDGSLTNIKTIKGIGAGCDEEAERVIALAPKWIPGKQRGRPVRQKMILPINFRTD